MRFEIKIIEILDDLKSKSLNIRWFKNQNQIMILILKSKSCPSLLIDAVLIGNFFHDPFLFQNWNLG